MKEYSRSVVVKNKAPWRKNEANSVQIDSILSRRYDELNTSVIHEYCTTHWFENHMALTFVYFLLLIYGSGHCFRISEKNQSHSDL